MAKRRLLQWMRDKLMAHADKVVIPTAANKALTTAYKKAEPLVLGAIEKRYPAADMKVLRKYNAGGLDRKVRLQFPSGVVTEFKFEAGREPYTPHGGGYNGCLYLADAATSAAVEKWEAATAAFKSEREKRLAAYKAIIHGAGFIEDVIDVWPEAKGILPAGSPPIPLGPEQIALVKADLRERKAA